MMIDLTADPRALRVQKRPLDVPARFATEDGVCETREGAVRYHRGDAILTGVQGESWPVTRSAFLATYAPLAPTTAGSDGLYRKYPTVTLALRLEQAISVPVGWQNDPLHGKPGDWLLRYEDGSHGVIGDAIFRQSYKPVPDETRWPAG